MRTNLLIIFYFDFMIWYFVNNFCSDCTGVDISGLTLNNEMLYLLPHGYKYVVEKGWEKICIPFLLWCYDLLFFKVNSYIPTLLHLLSSQLSSHSTQTSTESNICKGKVKTCFLPIFKFLLVKSLPITSTVIYQSTLWIQDATKLLLVPATIESRRKGR